MHSSNRSGLPRPREVETASAAGRLGRIDLATPVAEIIIFIERIAFLRARIRTFLPHSFIRNKCSAHFGI